MCHWSVKQVTVFSLFYFSFILLFITMLPMVTVFETKFGDLKNLSIGNFHGVTQVSLGNWRACYSDADGRSNCTATNFINNPYNFTIIESGNQVQVSMQQSWLNVMFLQFFVLCYTIFIGLLVFVLFRLGNNAPPVDEIRCYKVSMYLVLSVVVAVLIIIAAESIILLFITKKMQSLGTGNTIVNTTPVAGFILAAVADGIIIFTSLYIAWDSWMTIRSRRLNGPGRRGQVFGITVAVTANGYHKAATEVSCD